MHQPLRWSLHGGNVFKCIKSAKYTVPQVTVVFLCSFALIFDVSLVFMLLNLIEADTLQMAFSNVP